jgi:hypothetical protein
VDNPYRWDAVTPEYATDIIKSIKRFSIDETGRLEVWFEGQEDSMVKAEFVPTSFTYQLLELVETYLKR